MYRRIAFFCFTLVLLSAPLCLARDLAIIVDKTNPTSALTSAELQTLLKAGQKWPDGTRVRVFLTNPSSPDNRMILQRVYKMTPDEVRALFAAHKDEIQVVTSEEMVLTLVANTPGAIGIVNVYSINSQVKVVKVDEKLPLEQGYPLHGN